MIDTPKPAHGTAAPDAPGAGQRIDADAMLGETAPEPYFLLIETCGDEIYLFLRAMERLHSALQMRLCVHCSTALDVLGAAAARGPRWLPRFVLVDVRQGGGGMDGLTLLRLIRKLPGLEKLPVVMHSVAAFGLDLELAVQYGAADFVLKPSSVTESAEVLRAILMRWDGLGPAHGRPLDERLRRRYFPHSWRFSGAKAGAVTYS